jgi:hypothetical protein
MKDGYRNEEEGKGGRQCDRKAEGIEGPKVQTDRQ